jgi:hypothetical protein
VIVVDANLLLYAYDSAAKDHARAREWLEETLSSPDPVGLPWACLLAFLRIGTNPRALARPFSIGEATAIVGSWLAQPCVTIAEPGERHWEVLSGLLAAGQIRGPLVSDAHLAALTIEHGATLATTDRDFSRFDGLRTVNPLAPR